MAASHNPAIVTDHELTEIRSLIEQHSGIVFDGARERFFAARVREHATEKKMPHGSELLRVIRSSNVEYDSLLERLLTQETSFFRYPDVFDAFEKRVLPELHMHKFWANPRSLRIWSAGCATGEEPYSIAISILEALEFADAWELSILATDISRQALRQAEQGCYPRRELATLTPEQLDAYFTKTGNDEYVVKPRIRNMVLFAPMNLAQGVYPGRFDCIFCMNVLIYFTDGRRAALIRRFYDYLKPGGFMFLGHAETTNGAAVNFQTIIHRDARVFQKPDRASPAGMERSDELDAGRSTS